MILNSARLLADRLVAGHISVLAVEDVDAAVADLRRPIEPSTPTADSVAKLEKLILQSGETVVRYSHHVTKPGAATHAACCRPPDGNFLRVSSWPALFTRITRRRLGLCRLA